MVNVGWWASDEPLHLADGYRFRSSWKWPRPVSVSTNHRLRHMYVLGGTGSGKTSYAKSLLIQDVRANRGFTLIDPHMQLANEVIGYIAELALGPGRPDARRIAELGDKLVIVEPTSQQYGVPGINLLEVKPGQTAYQIVDAIISILHDLWRDSYGPRMEDICRNSLLLLQEQNLTPLELIPLLSDGNFRDALVQKSRNVDVRQYFGQHLAGLRPAELKTWVESSRNKWSAFLMNPFIRPILGQARSTIDFQDILDSGKWCIVAISRDRLKESRRLFGALLTALIHNAALSREGVPPERRVFHSILIDEAADFYTPVFLDILIGARKFSLGAILLHQNLTQEPFGTDPSAIDTLLANTHTRVVFSLSRKDAVRLAGELFYPSGKEVRHQDSSWGIVQEEPKCWSISDEREAYAAELMKQRQAEAFISFKGIGDDEPYVAQVPRVPDFIPDPEKVEILREHVASRYYRPLADVEHEIRERWARIYASAAPPPQIGRDYAL